MLRPLITLSLALCLSGAFLTPIISHAQDQMKGDAEAGAKIYLKCRSCHVVDQATNKMGPHLLDILGRTAGSVEGFQYSEAMKQAGKNGLIWNENTLKEFLTSPKTMIPGTSMRFWGLWENQINDLNAYLKEKATKQPAAQ